MSPPRVAVVGSGLTGLLIAQGLQKNGIPVVVYESDESIDYRQRDWAIMLHWGLETLGQALSDEVSKTFPEAFCDPFYTDEHPPALPCLDNTTGEPLFHIPSTRMRLISRRRFRKVLSRGLDVRYSKKLEQFVESDDGSLILVFADGAQYDADIIVGADGPKSIVRTQLLGEETSAVLKSPWVISITLFTCDDPEKAYFIRKLHPVWHMVYGPTGIAGIAVSDAGQSNIPTEWVFYFFRIWRDDLDHSIRGDEALRIFKEKSKSLCEPFRSAAEWVPEGSSCNIDQLKYWPSEPWDNLQGRVTLAGDAAHSAMPFRGQGFNRSMEDALQLVETVVQIRDGADREEAMRAYDRDVCERGRRAALDSVDEGQRNMDYERLMTSETVSKGFEKGKF